MLMGYGEVGKIVMKYLLSHKTELLYLVVRNMKIKEDIDDSRVKVITFNEKNRYIDEVQSIISCTSAPHVVLSYNDINKYGEKIYVYDLAVPRDIEPEVGRFEGVTLYDMDSFKTDEKPAELQEHLEAAGKIVREQMDEFFKWLEGKDLIPRIQEIKENAVNDFNLRIMKPLKNTHMEEQEKEQLLSAVDRAMEKVVNKMLFGLRDSMNEQAFLECVAGLEKTYEK